MPTEAERLLERTQEMAKGLRILEYRHSEAENETFIRLTPSFQEHFRIHKSELEEAHIKDLANNITD